MNTKNIFKALALAMLMPAMLLTTACSNDDDAVNNENTAKNGYTLPVTINVSRQDDGTTRATYTDNNNGTGTFAFGADDKLFVWGTHSTAGQFAGSLTWTSGGTFSGTITTEHKWTGSADALFTQATSKHATLLPAGYETPGFISITGTGYSAQPDYDYTKAFALTKGAAVEQFSLEDTDGYTGSGFVLSPTNSILNFNITGLAASTEVAVVFTNTTPNPDDVISKNVTTDGSGNAKFAIAIHETSHSSYDPGDLTLTVGGNAITINSTSKEFVAGRIYNIARAVNAINGKFSVSATKKVYFSKGNLQYDGTNWKFAEHQYDYIETATGYPMDHFTWGNTSSSTEWGGDSYYTANADLNGDTDWGSRMGSGWRTLTGGSGGEWEYLFNTRTTATTNMPTGTNSSAARYTKATVAGVPGVILFPDNYAHPAGVNVTVSDAAYNTGTKAYTTFTVDADNWVTMQSAGCVFLPAAGHRNDTSVNNVGSHGRYWSSTAGAGSAYSLDFDSNIVNPADNNYRNFGFSVRLVRPVQGAAAPAPEEDFVTFTSGTNTVKVAKMNLGATSVAESAATCYGDYYAWGATEPFGTVSYTAYNAGTVTPTTGHDGGYTEDNAPFRSGSAYIKYTGTSSATLEAADDAVAANMSGWHMPTQAEFQTLYAACGGTGTSKTPSSISSGAAYAKGIYWVAGATSPVTIGSDTYKVNGLLFVQDADTHVFFPAAGYVSGTTLSNAGSFSYYWSSSLDTSNANYANYAYILFLNSAGVNPATFSYRDYGYSVRPFKD